jgi:hypothetical protein
VPSTFWHETDHAEEKEKKNCTKNFANSMWNCKRLKSGDQFQGSQSTESEREREIEIKVSGQSGAVLLISLL